MRKEDPAPPVFVGRFGLAFAYLCFAVALVTLSAAVYLLPLDLKAKIFLAAGGVLLVSMIVVLAVATHLVSRPRPVSSTGKSGRKAASSPRPADADGSQRPR